MANLTSGRTNPCNDNIGGLKFIYLFPFVAYRYPDVITDGSEVTTFPASTIYKYEFVDGSFSEDISNDEEGINHNQNLTFTLTKQTKATTLELDNATKIDIHCIVQFNDGKLRILGLYNGCNISNIEIVSGGSKSDLNGYNVTIEGRELESAHYLDDLTGFTIVEPEYLLTETGAFLLTEAGEKIELE